MEHAHFTLWEAVVRHLEIYGWLYAAFVASPITAWRLVQWYKRDYLDEHKRKPPKRQMQAIGWCICLVGSYYSLAQHFGQYGHQVAFGAFIVATSHTAVIEFLFLVTGGRKGKVSQAFRGDIYGDDTVTTKLTATITGARVHQDRRTSDRRNYEGEDRRE